MGDDHVERRPDFYVIGAPKCGTTSLYHVLRQHPDVFMSRRKEPHFFTDPDHLPSSYDRMGVEAYLELFSNAPSDAVAGEASVTYLFPWTPRDASTSSRLTLGS